ncbi:efflux RND transporter periplasmic adaptor subunit [Pelagibacterium halotolerans]|uniref:efflux RND transporter periplasmic adaptor subunit n=1 Tax=Pelagibacterium halotolerans TaxID=531813 RepID=UPI00384F41ED
MAKKRSRFWITVGGTAVLAAALAYAFWPRPVQVDMGTVTRGPISVSISQEARTRVRDPFTVVAPVAGWLLRVVAQPGDTVEAGETVARMVPSASPMLDERTRAEAMAAIAAAEAALAGARAEREAAEADRSLAAEELERTRRLRESGTATQSALDEAERAWRAANAAYEAAVAAVSGREAELESARARLVGPDLPDGEAQDNLTLTAPISGTILRVDQKNAAPLAPGTPILHIGDIGQDLQIVAELLSTDAVQVEPGDRVTIRGWGGNSPLEGTVARIEPGGFTKVSALGVEEQRVNVIIDITNGAEERERLGAGYRVEVSIVVWEEENALIAPSSALFREGGGWAVFRVEDGEAHLTPVEVGRNNGSGAQILGGIEEGDTLILYPGPEIADGVSVEARTAEGG